MTREVGHVVGGTHIRGSSGRHADVFDPSSGAVQAHVALADRAEVDRAIGIAADAQPAWAETSPQARARVLQRFLELVRAARDPLATVLASEHGKTVADARGDIERGLEVVEFCLGAPHLLKGEYSTSLGAGIDVFSMRQPLGVVAGIAPFNFPAMIPLWQAAPALACGNAFILKPSERDPSVPIRLAELFSEAGLPAGIFSVLNGDKEAVDAIIADTRIRAVGFVGSSQIAASIYADACANGKRAQCFGSAKNHLIVMPDADLDQVVDALIGAGYGSAGERCMAISVAVPVGEATAAALAAALASRVRELRVGAALDPDVDFGPMISSAAVAKVSAHIARAEAEGAAILVDGRGVHVPDQPHGFYLGPTLLDHVTPAMSVYRDEVFGPVLAIVRAADYEQALALASGHEYGNGAVIYTRDGDAARDFATRVQAGMVGVNVPIPVPVAAYTFGGWKRSGFGDLNQHGPDAFRFFTKTKTVTSRWPSGIKEGASFVIPTSG